MVTENVVSSGAHPVFVPSDRSQPEEHVIVGTSPGVQTVRALINRVAGSDMTVLVRGETGTGKGLVARIIHQSTPGSRNRPFVNINCPAIPDALLESEMFGHERGAFTGAVNRKLGRFEQADGGTIFLDEIGHVSPAIQAKLLDVVESKEFVRVGGLQRKPFNARIVTATNAPLEKSIQEGGFREDLYYRLCQFVIVVPPLRERVEDIPVLANHFLAKHCLKYQMQPMSLTHEQMEILMNHQWPGNVRELQALMGQFALCGADHEIIRNIRGVSENKPNPKREVLMSLREHEIALLKCALEQSSYNQRRAASLLGLSYSAFRRRMSKFGLREFLLEQDEM